MTDLNDVKIAALEAERRRIDELISNKLKKEGTELAKQNFKAFFVQAWDLIEPGKPYMDNWHIDILCEAMEAVYRGDVQNIILEVPPRCQPAGTKILMSGNYYKNIEDIEIGDFVISLDLEDPLEGRKLKIRNKKVVNKWNSGEKEVLEFALEDGRKIEVSKDHLVYTYNRGYLKASDVTTEDYVLLLKNSLDYSNPKTEITKEDAFLLALWCAEGTKRVQTNLSFANISPGVISRAKECSELKNWDFKTYKNNEQVHRICSKHANLKERQEIYYWLDYYFTEGIPNNSQDIYIPKAIFTASKEVKREFVGAFIATDGFVGKDRRIGIEVTSKRFIDDFQLLLNQLGFSPVVNARNKRQAHNKQAWSLRINKNRELALFRDTLYVYDKQTTLLNYELSNSKTSNDIPNCLLKPEDFDSRFRYRMKTRTKSSIETVKKFNRKGDYSFLLNKSHLPLRVTGIKKVGKKPCFDIEVEEFHTYFSSNILVHNCSKSTIASVAMPAWVWLQDPTEKFITASCTASLSTRDCVRARRLMQTDWYKSLKPPFKWTKDVNQKTYYENTLGGYRFATSVGGPLIGHGFSLSIVDDPLEPKKAHSKAYINAVLEWWTQTMSTRKNSPDARTILMHQRLSECIEENSKILTIPKKSNSVVLTSIKNLQPGDLVESDKGFTKVLAIQNQGVKHELLEITRFGYQDPIRVTKDHPIWSVDKQDYVPAGELNVLDLVSFENNLRFNTKETIDFNIYFPELPQRINRNFFNIKTPAKTREEIISALDRAKPEDTTTEIAQALGFKNRCTLQRYISFYNLERHPRLSKYNYFYFEEFKNNKLFWRFVGLWLAKGWASKNVVGLGFHKDERYYKLIKTLFRGVFDIRSEIAPNTNSRKILFSSNQLAYWLNDNFGDNAHNKTVPTWFYDLPLKFIKEILLGFYQGDGSYHHKYYRFSSVSKNLLKNFQTVFTGLNYETRLYDAELRVLTSCNWLFKENQKSLSIKEPQNRKKIIGNKAKIKSIRTVSGNFNTYDIHTEAHNFICEGFLTHNCDPIGYELANNSENWEVICLPMEYDPEHPQQKYWDLNVLPLKDPRTEKGECLWEDRFPPKELNNLKKKLGPQGTAAQFQQNPVPLEGGIIKKDWFKYYHYKYTRHSASKYEILVGAWDLTFTNTGSSYTVGQVWGKRGSEKHLLEQYRDKWDVVDQVRMIRKMKKDFPFLRAILIENKANGHAVISMLKKEIPGLIAIDPRNIGAGDKETRLAACSLDFEAGNVYFPHPDSTGCRWVINVTEELVNFPRAEFDDIVDTVSMVLNWFASKAGLSSINMEADINDIKKQQHEDFQSFGIYNPTKKEAPFTETSSLSINQARDIFN